MVQRNELRDYGEEFDAAAYALFFDLLRAAWKDGRPDVVGQVEGVVQALVAMPEYSALAAEDAVTDELLRVVLSRFDAAPPAEHAFLREFLHLLYRDFPAARPLLRALMARFLTTFLYTSKKDMAVAPLLEVLGQVIKGFAPPLTEVHKALLFALLLPLHHNNEMYEWRDQIPVIQLYHEPLVFCLVQYLERDRAAFAVPVMEQLLKAWPEGYQSNSPKEVLCLHEVETLLRFFSDEDFAKVLPALLPRLERTLSTEHSRCLEKALTLWKDPVVLGFTQRFARPIVQGLFKAVYRKSEMHWNVTVNKMRALVLDAFREADPATFAEVANKYGRPGKLTVEEDLESASAATMPPPPPPTHHHMPHPPHPAVKGPGALFKHDAGGWKPPSARGGSGAAGRGSGAQPPVTITGVAPWAMGGGGGGGPVKATARHQQQPPVTITGVAPWAMGPSAGLSSARSLGGPSCPKMAPPLPPGTVPPPAVPPRRSRHSSLVPEGIAEEGEAVASKEETQAAAVGMDVVVEEPSDTPGDASSGEGLVRVLAFMEQCRPKGRAPGEKSWHEIQLEPTPTLLPDMRFHDLVFGQELGSGAFSTVKYARHIAKGKTRSDWSEYAVKVIDTARIVELGYEACVNREIAVLRLLAHPGIARMVSSFRWREGAYLVLEYASKGDLHSHLVQQGSLDEDSTRFVVGEIVAALRSVHDAGFVFGDLKPENVVITESGHVKITDFGGCRPFTDEARTALRHSRDAVRKLRDGDWRRQGPGRSGTASDAMDAGDSPDEAGKEEEDDEDERIEGTFAYLPPEVIRDGTIPDTLADAWALGCLLYQCLLGKPPVFTELQQGAGDADMKARVVRFAEERCRSSNGGDDDAFFSNSTEASLLSNEAKLLIKGLLAVDRSQRVTVEAAAMHPFFTQHSTDVYALHRGPAVQLAQGTAAPAPDAAWNRRQFSAIWAPLPANYSFATPSYSLRPIPETDRERGAPFSYAGYQVTEETAAEGGRPPPMPRVGK